MQGMIEVNDPSDSTELAYAIEAVCLEAKENDLKDHEIKDVLESHVTMIERGRL